MGLVSRQSRFDGAHNFRRQHANFALAFLAGSLRYHGQVHSLIAAQHFQRDRLVRIDADADKKLLPRRVVSVLDFDDSITHVQAGLFRGRSGGDENHVYWCFAESCILMMKLIQARKHDERQQNVHYRAGNRNQKTLPARVAHEFAGIAGAGLHGVLARHLYVAAEGQEADAIVSVATAEADQALAESQTEDLNPDLEKLGHRVVSQLMDE